MLKKLRIKNFKIWQDTHNITMSPITLFFGTNSSGKSSIGQFLMMLKQTVESPDRKSVFNPGSKNSPVQLGSFQEMVYHRDQSKKIEFEYDWDTVNDITLEDSNNSTKYNGDVLSFSAKAGLLNENINAPMIDEFRYKLLDQGKDSLSVSMKRRKDAEQKNKIEYTVDSEHYTLVRKKQRVWPLGAPVRFYGFPDEVIAYYQNAEFVQELNLRHEKLFRAISYLGPLRTKTERLYTWGGNEPESVGFSGENTLAAILSARNRKISLGYKKSAKPFEEIIALKIKEMGLIDEFIVKPISEKRQDYEVKVKTKGSKDYVDLPDVGFGISQVLPVIVQCFYAPHDSIIIMEQPEIHLHPAAQSALADVMIDVINSREDGKDRNIQLIIETHSEHFLRRLQRRIAEDKIKNESVSAYFSDVTRYPAKLEPLQVDLYGNIMNWPENFFGNEMEDITEQAKAAMKKREGRMKSEEEIL